MRGTRAGAVFSAAGLAVALGSGAFLSPAGVGAAAGVGFGRPVAPIRGPGGAALRGPLNQIETSNWSGYAVANFETGATYTGASGTWTVPPAQVAPGYSSAYSSSWVGIGGFCTNSTCSNVDSSLIQLGTDQFWSSSGGATYSAWYELIPNGPVSISSLTINAGDIVTASLTAGPSATIAGSAVAPATKPSGGGNGKGHGGGGGSSGQTWTLQMSVTAPGATTHSWSTTVTYDSSLLSGEWIEEAPTGCIGRHCEVLPLADYGTATFDLGTLTTSSGSSVSPALRQSEAIAMVDPAGETSTPSALDGDADGFSTCWANGTTLSTDCLASSS